MAPRTARRCPHCDAAIDPSAPFCDQCGNTLPATGSTQILPKPSARQSSPLLWVITVTVIGVVIGLVGVVWSRVSQPATVVMLVTSSVPTAIDSPAVVSISTPSVPSPVPATAAPMVSACLVPNVIRQDQGAAEGLIIGAGLQPVKSTAYDTSIPVGQVIAQDPPSRTEISPCQGKVTIIVSLGSTPQPTPVPLPTKTPTQPMESLEPISIPASSTAINCAPSVVFCDDFSSDPNINTLWKVFRGTGDARNEASWDEGIRAIFLTRAVSDKRSIIFANYTLTEKQWTARFKYRTGGSTVGSGADGFVFVFYKKTLAFVDGNCPDGGGQLCFETKNGSVPGYGVEFDVFKNDVNGDPSGNHIGLIEGSASNHLIYADDARTNDNQWHNAEIIFDNGKLTVSVDNSLVLNYLINNPNYTYSGIGFSGATGYWNNNHCISSFTLSIP